MKKLTFVAVFLCIIAIVLSGVAAAVPPLEEVSEAYAESAYCERLEAVELQGDYHADLVNVALSQIGYHEGDTPEEKDGSSAQGWGNCTEYGSVYGGLNSQWCAMFVSWCARQANIPRYVINTAARAYPDGVGGEKQYAFHINSVSKSRHEPRPGDLVFFSSMGYGTDHVGIVARVTEDGIWTVEGNSLNAVRMNYYEKDSNYISRYGVYDIYSEPTVTPDTVETTELHFVWTDAGRGQIPDDDEHEYQFRTLLGVNGRELSIPQGAFVREDAVLLGYHVQRLSDGAWRGSDGKWYSATQIAAGKAAELLLVSPSATIDMTGFWTEASEMRLYCVWQKDGETVPDRAETAQLTRDETGWLNPYADVLNDAWYYDAVRSCAAMKLLPDTVLLTPDAEITRGRFAELLYRMNGAPKQNAAKLPFEDVEEGDPHHDAIVWAWKQGLMSGASEREFAPQGVLTREQAAAILWRMMKSPATQQHAVFDDAETISAWAVAAMDWVTDAGILYGVPGEDGSGVYAQPKAELSMAQALAMIARVSEKK